MVNQMFAVRGAVCVSHDTREEVAEQSVRLFREMVSQNALTEAQFSAVSVCLTSTNDIRSVYPARAVRESGILDAPLFSAAEPDIEGALPLTIRILITVANSGEPVEPKHVYLGKAAALRPDLSTGGRNV